MPTEALNWQNIAGHEAPDVIDVLVDRLDGHPRDLVVSYYQALMRKRFVILAGSSGVDRIQLAEDLADVLAGGDRTQQWRSFQAHPWWTSHTGAPGYLAWVHSRFDYFRMLDTIDTARDLEARGLPLFIGIKRMSPAELVQYFEDLPQGVIWLPDGSLVKIRLPTNLFVTGTIDVEDTVAPWLGAFGYATAIRVDNPILARGGSSSLEPLTKLG